MQGLSDAGRLSAYRSTLKIIADNPWFGTGLGTFAFGFPAYRSGDISMQGLWDIAHNTHLEFASEMGIPLTLIVALAWIVALVVLSFGLRGRRRNMIAPLSSLAVSLIALLHSSIDFSLADCGLFNCRLRVTWPGAFSSYGSGQTDPFAGAHARITCDLRSAQ